MNLNLDFTRLVVLSVCEAGLGTIEAGEGVYGLQRALKVAGAQMILISLWKVDDAATQQLMVLFFSYGSKPDRCAVLTETLNKSSEKKYPHYYYRGAFVMSGE